MPEPTIDDLLKWLFVADKYLAGTSSDIASSREVEAIRAILEQHRDWEDINGVMLSPLTEAKQGLDDIRLKAIRAFVEKAEERARVGDPNYFCERFTRMIGSHLKDLEADNAIND